MDCARARDLIFQAADGELPAEQAAMVRDHAASCPVCGPLLADAERVRSALVSLPRMTAPADLWPAVQHRIRADRRRRVLVRRRVRRLVPAYAPLAAAAALCLAVFLHPAGKQEPVPPPPPDDVAVLLTEHAAFDNEFFVGGQDFLVAENTFSTESIDE